MTQTELAKAITSLCFTHINARPDDAENYADVIEALLRTVAGLTALQIHRGPLLADEVDALIHLMGDSLSGYVWVSLHIAASIEEGRNDPPA